MSRSMRRLRPLVGRVLRGVGVLPPVRTSASTPGIFVRNQVLRENADRPAGASTIGYGSLSDLSFAVAHAFESPVEARRESYRPIADLIRPGDRVLDVGCGDGTFLELARERGAAGVGIDLDPERVEACVAKGLEARCVRVQEIGDLIDERFDFVSLIHIIEHLGPDQALEILDAITRSLSDDGRIFILTPNISHPGVQTNFWLDVTHIRPYPEALLGSIVSALGFPCFQSGEMTFATETWCYAFSNPEHALRPAAA